MNPLSPRLAFVSSGLAFGGSTTFLCNLGGELVRQNLPILIVSLEKHNAFAADFAALGVPVLTQDDRRQIFEDRIRATLEALAEFRPTTVVGCLGQGSYEVLRYMPAGVTRVGLIQADSPMFYNALLPYAQFTDAVVGVSEEIHRHLVSLREFRHAKAYFLPYGVRIPASFTARQMEPVMPLRILYFGRLQRLQKRVHLFPDILRGLTCSGIPFVWTIVGEGEAAEFLAKAMRTDRPDQQVHLRGPVSYRDVPELLDQHDIFLLASDSEGLPVSLLEAMAHGLVPVVSDLPSGIRELIDDNNGCRVATNHVAGYSEAIVRLHRHPEEMGRLSRNAREKVMHEFSTQAMANRWLAAFPPQGARVEWPRRWKIQPPLILHRPLYFSPPARFIRRLALRLRSNYRLRIQRL